MSDPTDEDIKELRDALETLANRMADTVTEEDVPRSLKVAASYTALAKMCLMASVVIDPSNAQFELALLSVWQALTDQAKAEITAQGGSVYAVGGDA
jgi:hypothetical protein